MSENDVKKYLKEIGSKGGKTKGSTKRRGDSDYYKKIVEKRWENHRKKKAEEEKLKS
jgi:hypothetical protein